MCCTSQNSKIEIEVKELYGAQLLLPPLADSMIKSNYTSLIVVYINAEGCNPCKLKRIHQWKAIQKELDRHLAEDSIVSKLLFITEPGDKVEEAKSVVDIFYHNANVIYDTATYFKKNNKLPRDSRLHVFLLNGNNKVEVVGSPLSNDDMKKFYSIQITKLHNEQKNK